ncbi:unnamed protein product, partial [Polarella glacialis]
GSESSSRPQSSLLPAVEPAVACLVEATNPQLSRTASLTMFVGSTKTVGTWLPDAIGSPVLKNRQAQQLQRTYCCSNMIRRQKKDKQRMRATTSLPWLEKINRIDGSENLDGTGASSHRPRRMASPEMGRSMP